jgi:hypothetical protein
MGYLWPFLKKDRAAETAYPVLARMARRPWSACVVGPGRGCPASDADSPLPSAKAQGACGSSLTTSPALAGVGECEKVGYRPVHHCNVACVSTVATVSPVAAIATCSSVSTARWLLTPAATSPVTAITTFAPVAALSAVSAFSSTAVDP